MKAVTNLSPNEIETETLNLASRNITVAINLIGLFLLIFFGWLFLNLLIQLRPAFAPRGNAPVDVSGLSLVALILIMIGVLFLHEAIHGLFFWYFTGERPKFGINLLSFYTAAPNWYLPRNQFMSTGIAPFLVLTTIGLAIAPFVPLNWVTGIWIAITVNAAGAIGDFVVVGWLAARPGQSLIKDNGPTIHLYQSRLPQQATDWRNLLATYQVSHAPAQAAFDQLVHHYTQGQRHYHNLAHVQDILDTLTAFATDQHTLPTLKLAAWFHDAIYDSHANDNETKSAELAETMLTELGLPAGAINEVSRLIRLTQTHTTPLTDHNGLLLLDADLAPFAHPPDQFNQNSHNIRREYAWVPEPQYRQERIRILKTFQDRDRLYYTPQLFAQLEQKARQNIQSEIARLTNTPNH